MLTGLTIEKLAEKVLEQRKLARDFITPTDRTRFEMIDVGVGPNAHGDAPRSPRFGLALPGNAGTLGINRLAHEQLSAWSGIPIKYYDTMAERAPTLLATNVNAWMQLHADKRMVRTLDGNARAWLSDSFRPLDNVKLLEAALPAIHHVGGVVKSAEITERRLYIQVVSPKLEGEVAVGDVVQGGFILRNSEVGCGSLAIEFLLYRLRCLNGAITQNVLRRSHVGRKVEFGGGDEAAEFFSTETRVLEDATFFSKVRDTIASITSDERFQGVRETARAAAGIKVEADPVRVIAKVATEVNLSKQEGGDMLRHLIEDGDLSAWGYANAVTALAHEVKSYDRCVELEAAGGRLIAKAPRFWNLN